MGDLMGYDDWLQAQNRLLGTALLDPTLAPRVITELTAEDFAGPAKRIYQVMAELFRSSNSPEGVDAVAVAHALGGDQTARDTVSLFMGYAVSYSEFDRYLDITKQTAKLSRLRELGKTLSESASLDAAIVAADSISSQLVDRTGLKGYEPADLLASFYERHKKRQEYLHWAIPEIDRYVHIKQGMFVVIGAEPSGGKTAFALQQLMGFAEKHRVLVASLETDADLLFDRFCAYAAGIPMDALMDGLLTPEQWAAIEEIKPVLRKRTFRFISASGMNVAGIKAAAIGYRADIVVIDYLQIIKNPKNAGRYEQITEISMDLHIMAQTTGMVIVALSQVTNRDPKLQNQPLGIHSARESGQIEADADVIMMLDKHVEKKLLKSGCKANRILRIVKNKNGRCCNIPLFFDGRIQTFRKAIVPNPDWEKIQDDKKNAPEDDYEQLPMDTDVPF